MHQRAREQHPPQSGRTTAPQRPRAQRRCARRVRSARRTRRAQGRWQASLRPTLACRPEATTSPTGQIARIERLQLRRHQADAPLETLQRHTRAQCRRARCCRRGRRPDRRRAVCMKLDLPLPLAPCTTQQSPRRISSDRLRKTAAPSRQTAARRSDQSRARSIAARRSRRRRTRVRSLRRLAARAAAVQSRWRPTDAAGLQPTQWVAEIGSPRPMGRQHPRQRRAAERAQCPLRRARDCRRPVP